MDHSLQAYIERLSTAEIETLLRMLRDDQINYDDNIIADLSTVFAQRKAQTQERPTD